MTNGDAPAHERIVVWSAELQRPASEMAELERTLSAAECERAARFRFDDVRERYVAAHGLLRRILGACTGLAAETLRFQANDHGKPQLMNAGVALDFNLTHSGSWMSCAVTRGRDIGIDIEVLRETRDLEGVAARFFRGGERERVLHATNELTQRDEFYRCWTRKEAFLKAIGTGLTTALTSFEIPEPAPDTACTAIGAIAGDALQRAWWLADFRPAEGVAGALVFEKGPCEIAYRRI